MPKARQAAQPAIAVVNRENLNVRRVAPPEGLTTKCIGHVP
jgi:hypothetical protein